MLLRRLAQEISVSYVQKKGVGEKCEDCKKFRKEFLQSQSHSFAVLMKRHIFSLGRKEGRMDGSFIALIYLLREASRNRWELTQRPTTRQCAENERLWST